MISRGLGFILIPYMVSVFSPDEYGKLGIFILLFPFLIDLIHHSASGYYTLHYFKKKCDKLLAKVISEQILYLFLLLILLVLSYFIFKDLLNISTLASIYIIILSRSLNLCFLAYFKVKELVMKFCLIELIDSVIATILTLLLFEFFSASVENRLWSLALASFVALIFSILFTKLPIRDLFIKINFKIIKPIFSYGFSIYPHVLGASLILGADRLFLNHYHDIDTVGLYTLSFQYASILLILNGICNRIFQPRAYEYFNNFNIHKNSIQLCTPLAIPYILIIISFSILLIIFISLFEELLFKGVFRSAIIPCYILIISFTMYWISTIVVPFLTNIGKNKIISLSTLFSLLVNLIGNFFLVPYYGTLGASCATGISIFVGSVFIFLAANIERKKI